MSDTFKDPILRQGIAGAQMLFVAFGALVLMPLLTGMDPNVALFTAGIGTLLFQLVTRREVPVFLASSFAFIAPIMAIKGEVGLPAVLGGIIAAGVVYVLLSFAVKLRGAGFIDRLLPPVVIAPVIISIGLALSPVAVGMAMGGSGENAIPYATAITISMASLLATLLVATLGRGLFRLVPILAGIMVAAPCPPPSASSTPRASPPRLAGPAELRRARIPLGGHSLHAAGGARPGHRTHRRRGRHRLGDRQELHPEARPAPHPARRRPGDLSSRPVRWPAEHDLCGSDRRRDADQELQPEGHDLAAVFAILMAFVGKFGAALQSIPVPVMGGILCLLFGSIAVVGLNTLIRNQVDLSQPRNLIIVSVTLVFGIGGMKLGTPEFALSGISLAALTALLLNLLLPGGQGWKSKPLDQEQT